MHLNAPRPPHPAFPELIPPLFPSPNSYHRGGGKPRGGGNSYKRLIRDYKSTLVVSFCTLRDSFFAPNRGPLLEQGGPRMSSHLEFTQRSADRFKQTICRRAPPVLVTSPGSVAGVSSFGFGGTNSRADCYGRARIGYLSTEALLVLVPVLSTKY